MDFIKKHINWLPVILIVVILGPSLPFKFTGHPQPTHIFDVVGQFLGLEFFRAYGAIIIGVAELVAVITVIMPKTRPFGGLLTAGTMAGAIFFHLASPLGVTVTWMDENGATQQDGTLFYTAIVAFVCGFYLAAKGKDQILGLIGK
ncbi:DoxX family protein [Kordiimonas aquimaris]|uniref:DoxX family protein n=1 Tax=Kordiimonas aquimaris TaxID=707591 RepID=UPI0021D05F1C|nr:DoxX family protein [Kordiimonas aquimaris]